MTFQIKWRTGGWNLTLLWRRIYVPFVWKELKRKQTLILWILWNVVQVLGFVNIGCTAGKLLVVHSHYGDVITRKTEQNIVTCKSSISWDLPPYSPLKINGYFGGPRRLHLVGLLLAACLFLVSLTLQSWRCRWHVPPNVRWLSMDYIALYPRRSNTFVTTLQLVPRSRKYIHSPDTPSWRSA
jgi:hypothetical protein